MFDRESWPTITESMVELADSTADSAADSLKISTGLKAHSYPVEFEIWSCCPVYFRGKGPLHCIEGNCDWL